MPGGNREKLHRQKATLFVNQKGRCYWCGKPMALTMIEYRTKIPKGVVRATLDHLDDKLSPLRGTFSGQYRHVLACDPCQQKRSVEAQQAVGIDELHRRSGRYPGARSLEDRQLNSTQHDAGSIPAGHATLAEVWPRSPA